jgi:type III secretion system YopN/LcrE/InvE/MxiC family regulator
MNFIGNPAASGLARGPVSSGGLVAGGGSAPRIDVMSLHPDLQGVLLDSADELTQSLSGKAQERSLRERRVSTGTETSSLTRERVLSVLAIMDAQAAAHKGQGNPAHSSDSRLALAQQVIRQPGKARQMVREQGGDTTQQFLTLLEVAELISEGRAGSDSGGRGEEDAREAAEELLAEHGTEIRADINTIEVTLDMASGQVPAFRSAYKDAVMGQEGLAATVRHMLDMVPQGQGQDFLGVLAQMRTALGLDLAATNPSCEPARLQLLVSDLFNLEVIGTVLDEGQQLSYTLVARHAVTPISPTALTTDLLLIAGDRWVDGARFETLGKRLVSPDDLGAQVSLHTGVRALLRHLPVQVFASMESRQTVIDASQAALDQSIDREEGLI